MGRSPRLFYICYEFPVLTQTFTVNEVRELTRAGMSLTVVSCRPSREVPEPGDASPAPSVLTLEGPLSKSVFLSLLRWFVVRPLRLLSLLGRVATARYRDEPVKCWVRGFEHLLWGSRLASLTRREPDPVHYHAQFVDAASTTSWIQGSLTPRNTACRDARRRMRRTT